jgi:hypothetical protein
MGRRRRQHALGCRTNARGQGLGPTTRWSRRTKHQRVVRDGGILIPARLRTADAWANGGEDEDSMLKAAATNARGQGLGPIATLVSGRTTISVIRDGPMSGIPSTP